MFWELFAPSDTVLRAIEESEIPEHYAAVNVRFINSLDVFEQADYNEPFTVEMQKRLIDAVLLKVSECEKESEAPVILSSDSVMFLQEAARRGIRTIDPKGIGHIMNPGVSKLVILKTFVNLFLLAKAEKVYSILNVEGVPQNSLYKTQYPRYAAIVGDKPFIRI